MSLTTFKQVKVKPEEKGTEGKNRFMVKYSINVQCAMPMSMSMSMYQTAKIK